MTDKIENIQALRGVAALLVFFAHIKDAEEAYGAGGDILPHTLFMGVTGVDLFFLISGYVMVHVTADLPRSGAQSARFLFNRAGRIYPLYWAITTVLLVLYAGKKYFFAEDTPIPNFIASFLLSPDDHYPILPVGWTLVHEIYFYVIFGVILLFQKKVLPYFLLLWGAAIIAGNMLEFTKQGAGPQVWFNALTLEFIAGCFIAIAVKRGITTSARPALIIGSIWLLLLFILGANHLYPDVMGSFLKRALIFTPPYALLLYGAVALERRHSKIAPRLLIRAGDISYALYLVHVPVFLIIGKVLSFFAGPGFGDNLLLITATTFVGIFAAIVAHQWIELPLLRLTKSASNRIFQRQSQPKMRPDRIW